MWTTLARALAAIFWNRQRFAGLIFVCISGMTLSVARGNVLSCKELVYSHTSNTLSSVNESQRNDKLEDTIFTVLTQIPMDNQLHQIGADVEIVRCLPPGIWLSVARGRITQAQDRFLSAHVTPVRDDGLLRRYPGPMVGDFMRIKSVSIVDVPAILPVVKFSWADLFAKDKGGELSLQISDSGEKRILENMVRFQSTSGNLVVESRFNGFGSREVIRKESMLRNAAIAQFIRRKTNVSQIVQIAKSSDELENAWIDPKELGTVTLRMINHIE